MAQPPRRIQSPFVKQLLHHAGVKDEGRQPDEWPKILDVASATIEAAHEQKVITNGHVMAHAGGLIRFAMQFCPEEARGRVFDEFISELRGEIVGGVDLRAQKVQTLDLIEQHSLNVGVVGYDRATGKHTAWSVSRPVRNGPTDWYENPDLYAAVWNCVNGPIPKGAEE